MKKFKVGDVVYFIMSNAEVIRFLTLDNWGELIKSGMIVKKTKKDSWYMGKNEYLVKYDEGVIIYKDYDIFKTKQELHDEYVKRIEYIYKQDTENYKRGLINIEKIFKGQL